MIDVEGKQVGIMSLPDAIKKAEEYEVDLVEIDAAASPPVCRLMDYGKYKYQQSKKDHASRKRSHQVKLQIKEVKIRPGIDKHDYQIKVQHIKKFLEEGNKVKVSLIFRGREIANPGPGKERLRMTMEEIKSVGLVEQQPMFEGRHMTMVIAPLIKKRAD